MSVRMRHTRSHTNNRRSHHALVGMIIVKDKETGNLRLPHHIDEVSGMYRGKHIVVPKEKKVKQTKEEKNKKKPVHEHAEREGSKGLFGRMMSSRPKARSGMGGGV